MSSFTSPTVDIAGSAMTDVFFGHRVIIGNKDRFYSKLAAFQAAGPSKVTAITDFDFTLSKFRVRNGERGASCHKVLEDCDFITPAYKSQAQGLQRKYYPLEVDPSLDEATRTVYMLEWVVKAHTLLIEYGLTREIIHKAVNEAIENDRFQLRPRVLEFIAFMKEQRIPLLIFSAGIADILEGILNNHMNGHFYDEFYQNGLYVISNRCIFEANHQYHHQLVTGGGDNFSTRSTTTTDSDKSPSIGTPVPIGHHTDDTTGEDSQKILTNHLIGFEEPMLHVLNKKGSSFLHTAFFNRPDYRQRDMTVLIGDSLGDIAMSEGIDYVTGDNILRIGFLNDRLERYPNYAKAFDIVILDDPGFDVPLGILHAIQDPSTLPMPDTQQH